MYKITGDLPGSPGGWGRRQHGVPAKSAVVAVKVKRVAHGPTDGQGICSVGGSAFECLVIAPDAALSAAPLFTLDGTPVMGAASL